MYDSSIRFHARTRPHAVAISSLRRDITYRQFDDDIDRVAGALAEAGVADVKLVAVGVGDLYFDCLLLVALTRLGIGSLTLTTVVADHVASNVIPDLMITDVEDYARSWTASRVLHVSAEWVNHALSSEPKPQSHARPDMDAVGRITLSSGTTGQPKTIVRSWRQVDAAVWQRLSINAAFSLSSRRPDRLLNFFGLDTIVVFHVLANWVCGGVLVIGGEEAFRNEGAFQKLSPTKMMASPMQLQMIASWLSEDFLVNPELTILTGGSHLPTSLANALQMRVTPSIWNIYASSEADVAAMGQLAQLRHDDASGWIGPNAEVEVTDEEGRMLPFGERGAIRLRTPSLVSGYRGDEGTTARHFKNGWFYPGDFGSLSAAGRLWIEGRSDDLMNFGGLKILPHAIETAVLTCPGVKDVAAFDAPNGQGISAPWLAIVRSEGFDETLIAPALKALSLPTVHMAWTDHIPRNERGKVQRDLLRAAVGKSTLSKNESFVPI
jgi:2,3-dihydroxybenzoate-AMP ligase